MKTGVQLIAEERDRQINVEGWTLERDKEFHKDGQLVQAAVCYAMEEEERNYEYKYKDAAPDKWPWNSIWWKPTPNDRVRELVKAGALIAAEIDRLSIKK